MPGTHICPVTLRCHSVTLGEDEYSRRALSCKCFTAFRPLNLFKAAIIPSSQPLQDQSTLFVCTPPHHSTLIGLQINHQDAVLSVQPRRERAEMPAPGSLHGLASSPSPRSCLPLTALPCVYPNSPFLCSRLARHTASFSPSRSPGKMKKLSFLSSHPTNERRTEN